MNRRLVLRCLYHEVSVRNCRWSCVSIAAADLAVSEPDCRMNPIHFRQNRMTMLHHLPASLHQPELPFPWFVSVWPALAWLREPVSPTKLVLQLALVLQGELADLLQKAQKFFSRGVAVGLQMQCPTRHRQLLTKILPGCPLRSYISGSELSCQRPCSELTYCCHIPNRESRSCLTSSTSRNDSKTYSPAQ